MTVHSHQQQQPQLNSKGGGGGQEERRQIRDAKESLAVHVPGGPLPLFVVSV
jgi:hypothetical protein